MLAKNPLAEAWTLLDIATAAEATITRLDERARLSGLGNPLCNVVEGSKATWILVETFPNEEVRAVRHLARRRFGVFRPMQQRCDKHNPDKKLDGWQAVFPSWVFVFCFDVEKQFRRVAACPGVRSVVMAVDDEFVRQLGSLNWVYDEKDVTDGHTSARIERNTKRTGAIQKCDRKKIQKLKKALKRQGNWDPSTWETANRLAPHERIALLERAVNAPLLRAS